MITPQARYILILRKGENLFPVDNIAQKGHGVVKGCNLVEI